MNNRIDAIYARQSVDKKDSISIESQIEFCKYELKGGNCKEYKDKGYSGKNTERPQFQQLMRDIESGLVRKVVVYKLDRISRSILDFAKMMDFFQKYEVEFVSSTEKFDTSTPMGRAMLNICIVFAQLERETIQKRVQDAWYSRCQRGFKMGGKTPYGFRTEPYVMDGVRTKKLVIEPTEAAFVRQMYEMYADPQVSLHDITKKLTADGMRTYHGRPLSRATLSVILRNPIYVMADLDIYEFYKSQGTDIYNDAADFAGTNGCYYYQGKGNTEDKHKHLQGQTLVLAPHEGFIPSELWLKCRKKLLASHTYQPARKARNTWMAGKIKCGKCGYALMSAHSNGILYLRCTVHADSKACPGCGCVKLHELEAVVYGAMVKKLKDFNFQRHYGAEVKEIKTRNGQRFVTNLDDVVLHEGDTLVVMADDTFIPTWGESSVFVLLTNGNEPDTTGKKKRWFALLLLVLMIVGATVGELPITKEMFPDIKLDMFFFVSITTIIMAWTNLFPARKYTKYISWDILITIACAFAISKAMVNSGVADSVAKFIIGLSDDYGPHVLLAMVFIITNLFTELITNNAAAALAFPLALSISAQLGVSPTPFFVVICMAASASFSTPIGYQTNLIVQGIGNYKFTDFVRIGLPLNIITFLISIILIPLIWNF